MTEAHEHPLYQAALSVEKDERLAAKLAEWDATMGDGIGDAGARPGNPAMTATGTTASAARIIAILRDHEAELREAGIVHLSLFGSVARGDADADSDVDLAAELDPNALIGMFELGALERRLSVLIDGKADLVPEPVEKPRLRINIERDRLRVF